MESQISKIQTKLPPKNFTIESIVGTNNRPSPVIDIENSLSQDYTGSNDHTEDDDLKMEDNKMGYYFEQNRVPNFPFFMTSYDKRFQSEQGTQQEEMKRASPGSARSEVDSDGADDGPHGKFFYKHIINFRLLKKLKSSSYL